MQLSITHTTFRRANWLPTSSAVMAFGVKSIALCSVMMDSDKGEKTDYGLIT